MTHPQLENPKWEIDVGLPRSDDPDWAELRVGQVARWIINEMSEEHWSSIVRTLCNAYEKQNCREAKTDAVFLRVAKLPNIHGKVWIDQVENDEDEYVPTLCGEITIGKITIEENTVKIPKIPESLAIEAANSGDLAKILDIEILEKRKIESISTFGDSYHIIKLVPFKMDTFENIYGGPY